MGWGLLVEVDSSNDISTRNPAHLTGPADFLNSGLRTQLSYISPTRAKPVGIKISSTPFVRIAVLTPLQERIAVVV
jgi:hypothetical protein